ASQEADRKEAGRGSSGLRPFPGQDACPTGSITQDKKMNHLLSTWPYVAAMAATVLASNFLVQFPFEHLGLGEMLTWGAFTYPVAFLITDLTNRRFGARIARLVVLVGFIVAVALSIWLATPRIAIASGTAFLVAQLLDVVVFDRLRRQAWWRPPLFSTLISSALRSEEHTSE